MEGELRRIRGLIRDREYLHGQRCVTLRRRFNRRLRRLRGGDRVAVHTSGILNWLTDSDEQDIVRMWMTSPLSTLGAATHHDPVLGSLRTLRHYVDTRSFTDDIQIHQVPLDEVTGNTRLLLVDFAHIFNTFPVDDTGCAYAGDTRHRIHVLRLNVTGSSVARAMLQLEPRLLLDTDPDIVTFYDKLVRVGAARAMVGAGRARCREPADIVLLVLRRFHNALVESLKTLGWDFLHHIEPRIGSGGEQCPVVVRYDATQEEKARRLRVVLGVFLEALNTSCESAEPYDTFIRNAVQKLRDDSKAYMAGDRMNFDVDADSAAAYLDTVLDTAQIVGHFHRSDLGAGSIRRV